MVVVTRISDFPKCDLGPNRIRRCRHGLIVYLASDNTIGRSLELYGEFAESENILMTALLRPGDIAIDVGANVGTVTLALARRIGSTGLLYAFEPQRVIFQNLCATLALNGLTNVRAFPLAVGENAGSVRVPQLDLQRPANFGAVRVGSSDDGEEVPLVNLDSLSLASCALIKIDVEGMDCDVLLGADQTVARCRPFIYMEAKKGPKTEKAITWLQSRDYNCLWHFAAFYSRKNYCKRSENVFGNRGDINLLGLPKEKSVNLNLPRIERPDSDWCEDYQHYLSHR